MNAREKSLRDNIPELFNGKLKKMLYVGASFQRQDFLDLFLKLGYQITIVEAFSENVSFLHKQKLNYGMKYDIVLGDIVSARFADEFDVVFFWHGPEHLKYQDILPTLIKLKSMAKLVVLGCPFGYYKQGAEYGNPYEVHQSHLTPLDFESWGFACVTIGELNQLGSNITAWWKSIG